MDIRIDPEFQAIIYSLSDEESAQLEANIIAEGCRDPLVVWKEEQTLLDGHHRKRICESHNLPFQVSELSLPDRYAAIVWIINHQLGRRNLTPNQASDLRGRRYNLEKQQHGGDHKSEDTPKKSMYHFDTLILQEGIEATPTIEPEAETITRERLAAEYGVSPPTISRDGEYSAALDTLSKEVSPTIRQSVTAPILPAKAQPKTSNGTPHTSTLPKPKEPRYKPTKRDVIEIARTVKEQQVVLLPFMKRGQWPDYALMEGTKLLGGIPKDEHKAINTMLDQENLPTAFCLKVLRNLRNDSLSYRQHIYRLFESTDEREHTLAMTMAAKDPPNPDPQVVGASGIIRGLEEQLNAIKAWQDKWPFEPWSAELFSIQEMVQTTIEAVKSIQGRARKAHQERIQRNGEAPE